MEWHRGVNCIKTGDGRALWSLHRAEGLYGSARFALGAIGEIPD